MDGGAWLRIDGTAVDWIYRDLDRVRSCWAAAQRGEFTFHARVGSAGRWLVNEKGAIASAGRLPAAPPGSTVRAHGVLAHLADRPEQLQAAIAAARALIDDVRATCTPPQ